MEKRNTVAAQERGTKTEGEEMSKGGRRGKVSCSRNRRMKIDVRNQLIVRGQEAGCKAIITISVI